MSDGPVLSAAFQAHLSAGAAAWPGLPLPASAFLRHLAERIEEGEEPERGLAAMNAGDLFLSCACLHGVPGAIEAFDRAYLARVPGYLLRVDPSPAFADEILQQLREKLFVGTAGSPPRIAAYTGRGALASWVRVAAVRTALNLREQRDRQFREGHKADLAPALQGEQDPELAYIKGRHQAEFKEALQEAMGGLSSEQRNLLRLYFVDGLSSERIGALFQMHKATVARKLAGARRDIYARTRRLLQARLALSPSEFDSLAGLVRSQLHVSLGRLLKAE